MSAPPKTYHVETFGCQMNVNDSEKVGGLLQAAGYVPADDPSRADFVFLNTCAVREKAAEKLFRALDRVRRDRRHRPELRIGVGGCVAQLHGGELLGRAADIDLLVGTHNIARVPELLERALRTRERQVDLDREVAPFRVPAEAVAHTSRVRAYVTVIEGCNHVCSFCVVPRTRGPEVCRPAGDVVDEVRSLVSRGYPEVMLLGQTVNAYRWADVDFPELLRRVHEVEGLRRLRFTTSHPDHLGVPLARAFAELPRLCPYLHLPAQSGSDRILAAMRRGYTRAEYLEKVALVRRHRPDIALSGDVIVGYPGETEDDFQATARIVEEVGYSGLFAFTYSPRPGTVAARVADDVSVEQKRRRLNVVNELQQRRQIAANAAAVGSVESILLDEVTSPGRLSGRTPGFRIVHVDGPPQWLGREVRARITAGGANSLQGSVLATGSLTRSSTIPILDPALDERSGVA
jgi:tRNA-2-methylthio-N6-dimethylallyladenosine synthase